MELGTNQKIWVNALRSGDFKQCCGVLCCTYSQSYCCLGVAAELFDLKTDDNQTLDGSEYENVLGLNGPCGEIDSNDDSVAENLASMNDDGKTFVEIADFIEANSSLVFTKSV